jgi:hypothetical protein
LGPERVKSRADDGFSRVHKGYIGGTSGGNRGSIMCFHPQNDPETRANDLFSPPKRPRNTRKCGVFPGSTQCPHVKNTRKTRGFCGFSRVTGAQTYPHTIATTSR